ncbi:FKBP-type peptidyl-prolyl cis-trans isomerase [Methanotrichaceae archaeon M04Ac]|uniref:Peptidyl-prolyl cis-trans isomerase n=1 Tax=Candidatus Methanocrinis alkalitolerans TaxID=3033395 RepID=A0ABT5XG40_9EURY|nr:FKBP-type peptidyl-prolyl cis-trans isomerase [Candidatus Methanocrinis alkalitolerans]MDF0593593.1 FKBP-type peptidyl-prolyl cis-trans isomerase [Candidatus Methanocrinis alkalitolerans]
MTVKDGDFIKVDYTESVDGRVISTTNRDVAMENDIYEDGVDYGPALIVIGSGDVVEGFKDELIGKEIGSSGSVEVPPEKAYGIRDPENVELIPLTKFKGERPEIGLRVSVDGKMGTLTRIIGRKARIDYNHILADKVVKYDYTIDERIEERQEKLAGLIKIFAKIDLKAEVLEGDVAEIDSPWEMSYYKEWPMIRRGVAEMAMRLLDLKEVRYIESHKITPTVTSQLVSPPSKSGEEEGAIDDGSEEDRKQAEE